MPMKTKYVVTVCHPGYGMFQGGTYDVTRIFVDRDKARDYYTDMLVKYPKCEVKYEEII